ncbi:hypothetical protein ASD12_18145 [Mesorhizobium sp. Root102]|uniref:DNA cytosine methyltransferase n=1 Tax=Mesorhizobium sp. Root102 TaxID=1736422 RepID=UPI0006F6D9E3|nr:DNA cytosine methyltransferase [Mesorhizobium sp. Root102]KQU77722.1 hypothetical protein ASD12_18145 [Mesorhizobium sp. Root102]
MTLTYGSVCSGIEAASVAWEPLGWRPKFFSEIEAFPSAVLAHHYGSNLPGEPLSKNGVPNHGDFTSIPGDAGPVDLLVGGTPCQSFSVAGKRLGLDDPRGNLALEYVRLAKRLGARWVVWENVPGVFSSAAGRDFADFLGFLTGRVVGVPAGGWRGAGIVAGSAASYGIAWRVSNSMARQATGRVSQWSAIPRLRQLDGRQRHAMDRHAHRPDRASGARGQDPVIALFPFPLGQASRCEAWHRVCRHPLAVLMVLMHGHRRWIGTVKGIGKSIGCADGADGAGYFRVRI